MGFCRDGHGSWCHFARAHVDIDIEIEIGEVVGFGHETGIDLVITRLGVLSPSHHLHL